MQPNTKGISFKTASGNSYYYSDSDGTVIPESYRNHNEQPTNKIGSFSQSQLIVEELNDARIKQLLFDAGYSQLVLVVTEQCNLRCKYCSFSGQYINSRVHSNTRMESDVAERAINTFMPEFITVKKQRPNLPLRISFYGGEPLLNFSLIRYVVAFIKKRYRGNILFNLTTNGTLLTSEMLSLFRDNNFNLLFSLNGNPVEHNRLRVFPDGRGSFDLVWRNLQTIRHIDPSYFNHNCGLSIVYDVGTDLNSFSSFFEGRSELLPGHFQLGQVNQEFTAYYTRYSDRDYENYNNNLKLLQKRYVEILIAKKEPSEFLHTLISRGLRQVMRRLQNVPFRTPVLPFTATCFPGMKMAVYPDGSLHCCERINNHFPIGEVGSGFNHELILKLINDYRKQIYSQCFDCPITRFCKFCFANFASDGMFQREPQNCCEKQIEVITDDLAAIWSLLEKGVSESVFNTVEREL